MEDPASMAKTLNEGKESELTLCLQSEWLAEGAKVTVKNLVAGYGDQPNILKGLSFEIEPMCRAAIMGPSGCGKSTFLQCLLRLLEPRNPDPDAPAIKINDVDIMTLGLKTLRAMIGVVPQDPVVFSGPLRQNLDPFQEHSDERLWEALRQTHLADHLLKFAFPNLPEAKLDRGREVIQRRGVLGLSIQADGENLSFGQRQLLCISRMILRQPGILLLDECTSSIDPRTQQIVTDTIREGFPKSTTIAVAHRLETIMEFDKVIVLERGMMKKVGHPGAFASPKDLLKWSKEAEPSESDKSIMNL
jgi:ABC-type multidrug transport system fused ATPase/permease subunit